MKKLLIVSGVISFALTYWGGYSWAGRSITILTADPTPKTITWEEYQSIIAEYRAKIADIKNRCDLDTRCEKLGKEKKVIFRNVKSVDDITKQLNKWINTPNNDYAK